jgi:hypothetical protein
MDAVETGVLEMADDLYRFFGGGSFAGTTLSWYPVVSIESFI